MCTLYASPLNPEDFRSSGSGLIGSCLLPGISSGIEPGFSMGAVTLLTTELSLQPLYPKTLMKAIIISNYVCKHVHICVGLCACIVCSLFCVFDHVISRQSYAGIPLIRVTFLSFSFFLLWSQYITETSSSILNRYGQNMNPHLEVDLGGSCVIILPHRLKNWLWTSSIRPLLY